MENEIERLNEDIYFGALYDNRKVQKKLENSARLVGYDEGIEEGKKENSIEIAKTMLQDKMPTDIVAKYTGLSLQEVKEIIK